MRIIVDNTQDSDMVKIFERRAAGGEGEYSEILVLQVQKDRAGRWSADPEKGPTVEIRAEGGSS